MEQIQAFLKQNNVGFLATTDNEQPRCRPFQYQFTIDGKFYFCTAKPKEVYKQLQNNPQTEFSAMSNKMETVRLSGKVEFSDDMEVKKKIIDENELVRSIYKTADNPDFAIFFIEHGEAVQFDMTGNPPKKITF